MAQLRFGQLPDDAREVVARMCSGSKIEVMIKRVLMATSWQEFVSCG
jgi:hypothetical protein